MSGVGQNISEPGVLSALVATRCQIAFEVHQDFYLSNYLPASDQYGVQEETLPVNQSVCVIGTYDQGLNAITPAMPRLGHDMVVYRGDAAELTERLGKEVRHYFQIAGWMVGIGVGVLLFALLPGNWTQHVPLLGSLVIVP